MNEDAQRRAGDTSVWDDSWGCRSGETERNKDSWHSGPTPTS